MLKNGHSYSKLPHKHSDRNEENTEGYLDIVMHSVRRCSVQQSILEMGLTPMATPPRMTSPMVKTVLPQQRSE